MSRPEIDEVASGIWSIRRGRKGSTSYLVKIDPGGILIDTGSDPTGADVMQCLQIARVGLRSLRAILLTHAHAHASSGARALRERSGAPVLASMQEAEALFQAGTTGRARPRWRRRQEASPFHPDGHLGDGDRIETFFRAVATPGHSSGHLAFWLEPMRALFAGDAIRLRNGAPELSPGTAEPAEARESMRKCLALEPELVLPGRGDPLILSGRRGS